MNLDFNSEKPIFVQVADGLEDSILTGAFEEGSQIPSITEISVTLKINPATALKGINILTENGIVYKKRGVGMFVAEGAKKKLTEKRRNLFFENYVKELLAEAKRLGVTKEEIIMMLDKGDAL